MKPKMGIVMDPIHLINIKKDTSFAFMLEAQQRGWPIYYMEVNDLYFADGVAHARMRELRVERNPDSWFEFGEEVDAPLDMLDTIFMRKDPPFDSEYIYCTYLLEKAEEKGVLIINKPQALRDANEKVFTAWFPQCCTDTLVTRSHKKIREFLTRHREIVLKPLDGMGGRSIFRVREDDPNLSVILETMTLHEQRFIMVQRYLPEIAGGDKRILLINGEVVPYALARIPAQGESRGNLAAGGRAEGRPLTERDRWIASQVGPTLREKGLVFVGIDVIGDYLTEINVTSPTCVQELDNLFQLNISAQLFDEVERLLTA